MKKSVIIINAGQRRMMTETFDLSNGTMQLVGYIEVPLVSINNCEMNSLQVVRLSGAVEYYEIVSGLYEEDQVYMVREMV